MQKKTISLKLPNRFCLNSTILKIIPDRMRDHCMRRFQKRQQMSILALENIRHSVAIVTGFSEKI